jgi:hypothetical protein
MSQPDLPPDPPPDPPRSLLICLPTHLIPRICIFQELGEVLLFSSTANFVNSAFVERHEIWDNLIQQNFLLTLSNPPVLPKSIRGRQMFDYLVVFDKRNYFLASMPMNMLIEQLNLHVVDPNSSELSIQRKILTFSIEICQRKGGTSRMVGNMSQFKMNAATLVPGTFVSRHRCPTTMEVQRSLVLNTCRYLFRPTLWMVQASTNGMVSLLQVEQGFGIAIKESSEWFYPMAKKHGLVRNKNNDPTRVVLGPLASNLGGVQLRRSEVACVKVYEAGDSWCGMCLHHLEYHALTNSENA